MARLIFPLLASIQVALGWGDLGHRTVVALATKYLEHEEVIRLQNLVGEQDLTAAGLWADKVCHEDTSSYTCSWHYVNVHDDPPASCGLDLDRDHKASSQDIFTAFANHTAIARSSRSSKEDRGEAMKFLFHWVGDVHQPLHVEGLGRGGVDIPVLFANQSTNLHAVWDFKMIEKARGSDTSAEAAYAWADELYSSDPSCVLDKNIECDLAAPMDCILHWAREANRAVCEVVLKPGLSNVINHELSKEYYAHSMATVNLQVLRAGRRLAGWIKMTLAEDAWTPWFEVQGPSGAT